MFHLFHREWRKTQIVLLRDIAASSLLSDLSIPRLNSLGRGGIGRCMSNPIFPVVASKESSRSWESVAKVALAETV
jgi:hypothetical protein